MANRYAGGGRKPRKPVLSPTKIGAYLSCPLLYKLTYIDKLGRYLYRPKSYHSFGSSLHRALSDFHSVGGTDAATADDLVSRLRDRWVPLGYNSDEEEKEHLKAAEAMLIEYHSTHAEPEEKTLLIEQQIKVDMGYFVLVGRIDRLVELADGTISVIDYKSGRTSVTEDDVRYDLAIGIYQLLVSKNYPDRPVTGTIYCLRTNVEATVGLSPAELDELEDEVGAIADEILRIDGESVIDPVRKAACEYCDFLARCKRQAALSGECLE